jgi:hypothetical protein
MPILLKRYPIAYHPTPKVACTSIKLALFELECRRRFERLPNEDGILTDIHNSWRVTHPFTPAPSAESYYKFAVVRDPLDRFLSAYANRVVEYGELNEANLTNLKGGLARLTPNPSLSEFIASLDLYRAASAPIRHHTDPQTLFIGKDLSYYNRIFRFCELNQIPEALDRAVGAKMALPHEQRGGLKIPKSELSPHERRTVLEFYTQDYSILQDYYHPSGL